MALALPAGWLDTGITQTHTLSVNIRLRAQSLQNTEPGFRIFGSDARVGWSAPGLPTYRGGVLYAAPAIGATNLGCSAGALGIMTGWSTVELVLVDSHDPFNPADPSRYHALASGAGACSNPGWLGPVTAILTVGPLRLGATIEASGSGNFLRYAWFYDAATTETLAIGGFTVFSTTYTDPPSIVGNGGRASSGGGPYLGFFRDLYGSGGAGTSVYDHVEFSSFQANGSSLATPGTLTYKASYGTFSPFRIASEVGVPFQWTGDLDADDSSGAAVAANASYNGAQTCPATVARTVEQYYPESTGSAAYAQQYANAAVLADPWLSAQTIRPYSSELAFTLEGNKPKTPAAAFGTWDVGTVTLTSPLSVLLSSNAWTVDAGTVTIGGTPTAPSFSVTAAPATVKRALLSQWRNWNAPADPLFVSGENYTATKRTAYGLGGATPDVWGWGLYAYLDVNLTPAAAGTLTFEITWAVVRQDKSLVTVVRNYPATWGAAQSTQRIDLLFPTESGHPLYGERVDQIRILGLPAGTTTLNSLNLVTSQDAYLKVGGIRQTLADGTVTTGGITLAQDGQMAGAQWGQDPTVLPARDRDSDGFIDHQKDHQNGRMAYASSPTGIVSDESLGGAVGMTGAVTIQDVFTELNRMEGVTATYDPTALNSDLTDGFGNSIGISGTYPTGSAVPVTRDGLWLKPVLPHARVTAGVAYHVLARLVVDDVSVPTGRGTANVKVYERQHLGGVIEAQCLDNTGARAAAGATITARVTTNLAPSGSDAALTTAATDASGFVTLPVRNGTYLGAEPLIALTG